MPVRQEHLQKPIFDRQLDLNAGYLVYFDNICMNEFIRSYVTNVGISVGMSSASVTMIYAPQFKTIDVMDEYNGFYAGEDGIQNGTNLRIFAENPFSNKYEIIFDGIIKGRNFSRSPYGFSISFSATDYMYWLNRTVIPISIPFNQKVSNGDRIRWKGQGIDVDNVDSVNIVSAGQLTGKTIREYWYGTLKSSLLKNSSLFSDPNTVAVFDNAINRVELMGDINPTLVQQQVIDLVITAGATFADTAYVSLNTVASNLLMEFYQDKDGVIRLKPPFWNEPVLKSHVIDPIMIRSGSEDTNWGNMFTRVIAQGGVEEWEANGVSASKPDLLTPVGVYVGNLKDKAKGQWADYLGFDEDYVVLKNGGDDDTNGSIVGSVGTSNAEHTVYSFLTETMRLRKSVACGIMANINKESGFNVAAEGDNGSSYGLCQWHNTRFYKSSYLNWPADTSLQAFCEHNNYDWKTINAQLEYLRWDISSEGAHSLVFDKYENSAQGAREAAIYFCQQYEVPRDMTTECAARADLAEQYYNSFEKEAKPSSGNYQSPFPGQKFPVSEEFGYRERHPVTGKPAQHHGIDIKAGTGVEICACRSGKIIQSAFYDDGYGKRVVIDHGNNSETWYCHCSELLVKVGESVTVGDVIAKVGSTGVSTGPHLHLGFRIDGKWRNPRDFLSL